MKRKCNLFFLIVAIGFLINQKTVSQSFYSGDLNDWLSTNFYNILLEHREFVSLPNDAAHPDDMLLNAEWLKNAFNQRGFEVKVLEAGKIPIVFAQHNKDVMLPTVLFYFHYDGQAVDPSKWNQEDPFIPVLKKQDNNDNWQTIDYESGKVAFDKEWRVYGRAAADDKGPIMMFLSAMDYLKQNDIQPKFNIKVLLDGEEEKGSAGLKSTLDQYKEIYKSGYIIIMDGPAHLTNRPTLTFGCRGNTGATLTVYGPKLAQHSGHFGNYAPNPVFIMSHLLASMKDESGKVLIEGFYDGIDLNSSRSVLQAVPDDLELLNRRIGIAKPDQVGTNYQESLQFPSLNVRGMASGWIGIQTRTIIPDKAIVQLGIRLVTETDGKHQMELVRRHIRKQGFYLIEGEPTDEQRQQYSKIASLEAGGVTNAFRTDVNSATGKWLTKALTKVHQEDPVRIRIMGGTVPVTALIEALKSPAVIVPMVNMDNNQHSPNENLRLGNLYDGIKTCVGILTEPIVEEHKN